MASKKYWYYMYLGSQTIEINPLNLNLQLVHYIDEDWPGVVRKKLTGSFQLQGAEFDLVYAERGIGYWDFWISEVDIDLYPESYVFVGQIQENNTYDFNQRIVEFKDFYYPDPADRILNILDREFKLKYGVETLRTIAGISYITASASIVTLTNTSNINQIVTGSVQQSIKLFSSELTYIGKKIYIANNSSQNVLVYDQYSVLITLAPPGFSFIFTTVGNTGIYDDWVSAPGAIISYTTLTQRAFVLSSIIENFVTDTVQFSAALAWKSSAPINLAHLKLANNKDIINYASDTSGESISLKRILEIIQIIYKGYWYIDTTSGNRLKFKIPSDLVSTFIDLADKAIHKKIKTFNEELTPSEEILEFHENNIEIDGSDWDREIAIIKYNRDSTQKIKHDLKDICTRISEGGDYKSNGLFLAYASSSTVFATTGYKSLTFQINGSLSPANILSSRYRDFIYTDRGGFYVCGNYTATKPTRFREFIELEPIETILPSCKNFYEGIIYEKSGTNRLIARVYEQSTDLNSNVTTFKSYEFENNIN